jgi:parvulin-like peptidyl-prolyl isomerase
MAHFPFHRSAFASLLQFTAFPALLLAGVVFLAGCHPAVTDPNDPKFVVAEKGDWKVTKADLDMEVGHFLKQRQATPEMVGPQKMQVVETAMLRNMVLKKLLLDRAAAIPMKDLDKEEASQLEAVQQGVPPGKTFDQALQEAGMTLDDVKKQIHERVLVSKLLEAEAFKNVEPTDQEINDIYLQHKDSFNIPEKVRVSRILIHVDDKATPAEKAEKKKLADKAHDRVMHNEEFGKVADEMSEDQSSKGKGGDLGYVPEHESEPGFDEVAFKTKVNTVSPVFLTPLGYEIIKVTDIKPAGILPLADARGYISSKLREIKMQAQEQDYAKNLMATSGVVYHMNMVDPPAQMMQGGGPGQGAPSGAPAEPPASASTPPMTAPVPPATNSEPAK